VRMRNESFDSNPTDLKYAVAMRCADPHWHRCSGKDSNIHAYVHVIRRLGPRLMQAAVYVRELSSGVPTFIPLPLLMPRDSNACITCSALELTITERPFHSLRPESRAQPYCSPTHDANKRVPVLLLQ
jgi:hypothetical protein